MRQTNRYSDIVDKLVTAIGLLAIVPASVIFFVLMPRTFTNIGRILQFSTQNYIFFSVGPSIALVIALIAITSAILLFSLSSLAVRLQTLSSSFRHKNSPEFFRYLSIFVLVQLVLSVIISVFFPQLGTSPIFNEDIGVQNFLIPVISTFQAIILELLPITVILSIYFVASKKFNLKSLLNPDIYASNVWIPIVIIATTFAAIVYSYDFGESVIAYVTFFVLNIIYLKFGFLKAFLANFTISAFNMIAGASISVPFLTTIITIFLFVWAFFGMYSIIEIAGEVGRKRASERAAEKETRPSPEPQYVKVDPNLLWIRSSCPNCGNASFHIKENMKLVCDKCEHEIDKDAEGEYNIRIEYGRPSRF